jgi:hypothetical protein
MEDLRWSGHRMGSGQMEHVAMRFVVPDEENKKKGKRTNGERAMAYWDRVLPELPALFKSGDPQQYKKALSIYRGEGEEKSSHVMRFGDELDWMIQRLRRMVREIRHKAGTFDTADPEVARFCAEARSRCRLVLRKGHKREWFGGGP